MKKYFLIISLFICFNLTAAEIEIISDKPGDGKKNNLSLLGSN